MGLNEDQRHITRGFIRRYCERAENNRANIHYSQQRPMTNLGVSPSREFTADCSGFVTGAYRWADKYTKFAVQDPNGLRYSGYGYTGTLLSNNVKRRVPLGSNRFLVGDMALYGSSLSNTKHVVVCRRSGNSSTSVWTSHGSEAGPYSVRLNYRSDLLVVVRSVDLVP